MFVLIAYLRRAGAEVAPFISPAALRFCRDESAARVSPPAFSRVNPRKRFSKAQVFTELRAALL
jgi:hypothetical protein